MFDTGSMGPCGNYAPYGRVRNGADDGHGEATCGELRVEALEGEASLGDDDLLLVVNLLSKHALKAHGSNEDIC